MPLMHGKSPKAFSKNVKTEMEHGKPQKQALAIAYATKRAAKHGMAMGGEVDDTNEKLHPRHEMIREHMSLVNRMMDDHKGYAEGGMIGHDQSDYEKEGNLMDESEAHTGLHDVDDPFDHNSQHFPTDMFSEDSRMNSNMVEDEDEKKKKRYSAMREAMGM